MSVSERLVRELASIRAPFSANDNIAPYLRDGDLEAIQAEAEQHVRALLRSLVIDTDHNTTDTPARVARMLVQEAFAGRYQHPPMATAFPNVRELDELYTVGPVTVRSTCAHHLVPIMGEAWIGVIPGARVIGLSKFARLTRWVMARPQMQEEAVVQLADAIEQAIEPQGLGVVIRATHMCMVTRGVCDHASSMTTSVMRGALRDNHAARDEFLRLIGAQGFGPC
ncbi:GTP cyclohydrolase I [Paraburkholderia sp. HD33-4]|uniref:GTP cyclohydrolase I n=1 Tax=Paraburkholderia sp. HD33-4 TaxID=2883242 RepID=UPI001F2B3428|nr:GTP cyclohydrolase I [Paraburkholderia sp. HD33-4]